jgi:hypothetical protein
VIVRQHILCLRPVRAFVVVLGGIAAAGCDREEAADPVVTTPPPTTAPVATAPAGEVDAKAVVVDEATRVKFKTLLEQVTQHIRNREFDAADTGLREIERMRATLDGPMKQQITTTRAALSAARAAPTTPPAT